MMPNESSGGSTDRANGLSARCQRRACGLVSAASTYLAREPFARLSRHGPLGGSYHVSCGPGVAHGLPLH